LAGQLYEGKLHSTNLTTHQ